MTGPNQNPRNEGGDQVVTALNRITNVLEHLGRVLIDLGATHSFVDPNFMKGIDVKGDFLPFDLKIKTPTGKQYLIANKIYRNCEI